MSKSLLLIGAAGVGAYLLFREQIDAMLSGEQPSAISPSGAATPKTPSVFPRETPVNYPQINPQTAAVVPPPAWAVGNWYWVQGSGRQFAIDASGGVTLLNNGRTSHGTYNNNVVFIDGNSSPVTQNGSYLRTLNQSTGEVSDYSRTPTAATTQPFPTVNIPEPTIPSPYPTVNVPTGGGYPISNCLNYPCLPEPEIFI